jgi:hypothetical protein
MESKALNRALALIADGTLTIDNEGRIWRHRQERAGGRGGTFPRRAESKGGKGYWRVMLWIDGELRGVGAHRVVWTHVNGPIPNGKQINHLDLDKRNNQPLNLELASGAENIQHSYANGRVRPWSAATEWRKGKHRLTDEQVSEARRLRAAGVLLRDIAARFGIGTTHAHRITSPSP